MPCGCRARRWCGCRIRRCCPSSALLHFILVELRPIYPIYVSAYGIVTKGGSQTLQKYTEAPDLAMNETMLDRFFCIEQEVAWASWLPTAVWQPRKCWPQGLSSRDRLYWFNVICIALNLGFVLVLVLHLARRGAFGSGFASGRYLACTWRLGESSVYRCCIISMICCFSAGFLTALMMTSRKIDMLRGIGLEVAVIVASIICLWQRQLPSFTFNTELDQICFRRSWHCIFWQSNEEFAHMLASAMWQYRNQERAPLDAILCPRFQSSEVLLACGVPQTELSVSTAPADECGTSPGAPTLPCVYNLPTSIAGISTSDYVSHKCSL